MESEARRAAFVTGASYGIGAAVAVALARDGFDVAVSDLTTETLVTTVSAIETAGGRAVAVALDLRSQENITRAIAEAARVLGGLEVLVNNAGVPLIKPALDITPQEWDALMSVNLTGTFFISQAMGRYLIGRQRPGSIISIASTHGVTGAARQSAYGISKAAVIHMTRMLAIEWAEHGIRVNAVAPGKVDTPSPVRQAVVADPANRERMLARIPMRRFAAAEEVAAMVSYLAGPHATYITGQTLLLDGGLTAY
jgi:NAD(P)-dependent dehydrogenase (short-subunit alcohol dehydrogenase family)